MTESNHQRPAITTRGAPYRRRRRLTSPAAFGVYGLIIAGGTAGGFWLQIQLGAEGSAPVPVAVIVPGAAGLGIVGIIVGRGSTRPPGGPARPSPATLPAITTATVTAIVPTQKAPSDLGFAPSDVLGHSRPEVTS